MLIFIKKIDLNALFRKLFDFKEILLFFTRAAVRHS